MALTAKGTPYVVSTDLVANYPTVSSDLATHIDAKLAYNAVTINAQTGSGVSAYTFALADATEGKLVTATNAATATYTVPPQASVTWPAGAVLRILNQGAGVVTIAGGAGVTINGTPLTLAQYKGAALQRTASNTWTILPFAGGVGNLTSSNTPTGTYTGYQYWTYNASGTFTVTGEGGLCDILLVGGGGGGGGGANQTPGGGGGAGGHVYLTNVYLPSGTHTVTVGAGGGGGGGVTLANLIGNNGFSSRVGPYYVSGGGGGGCATKGLNGGSGGGAGGTPSGALGGGTGDIGNNGGAAVATGTWGSGGGGGHSAAGATGTTVAGGNGGAGTANSITGASVTRAGGGGGGSQGGTAGTGGAGGGGAGTTSSVVATAGTANTGGGGGGSGWSTAGGTNGPAGGSGVVIIRAAV